MSDQREERTMNVRITEDIDLQAERWYARLAAPDCPAAERSEFSHWRAAHVAHAEAYERLDRTLVRFDEAAAQDARLQELLARARAGVPAVAPRRRRNWALALALAASVFACVGGWQIWRLGVGVDEQHYEASAVRAVVLGDGSNVQLDVGSHLSARMGWWKRSVTLSAGRAFFQVAHDAKRPFTVHTDRGSVTALGTQFQVERRADEVTVTLTEGRVAVVREASAQSPARSEQLQPGQQIRFSLADAAWDRQAVDVRAVTGWTRGRLIFRNTRLTEVIDEVNRYSARKLVLAAPSLADLPVNGNFVAGDAAMTASALRAVLPIRIDDQGEQIALQPRR